jgi:hypothetical protein
LVTEIPSIYFFFEIALVIGRVVDEERFEAGNFLRLSFGTYDFNFTGLFSIKKPKSADF